jgi:5-oxoprolinase (ATP-hydrolysing)
LIGNQSRPRIFDLNIRRPPPLYSTVIEIDERVTLVGYTSDPQAEEHKVIFDENGHVKRGYRGKGWDKKGDAEGPGRIVQGISGEAVRILKEPSTCIQPLKCNSSNPNLYVDEAAIRADLQRLYDDGYRSVAVVLAHSYTFPDHELLVGKVASSLGFEHISLSSQLLPMIKMVPRGVSATADAYLTPILRAYLDGFFSGFAQLPRIEFMSSDGGLVDASRFSGLKTILSGPAGGVVGYARTSWDEKRKTPIIGSVSSASLFTVPWLTRVRVIDSTWEVHLPMYHVFPAAMRLYMRQPPRVSRFNRHNLISTPSQLVEALVSRFAMVCSLQGPKVQEQNLVLPAIGEWKLSS